jgi:tripeptide aminopeptidase
VKLVSDGVRDAGFEPTTLRTGGGSDANVLAALGVPALALASGMKGVHGTEEQLAVSDLEALTRICHACALRLRDRASA